MNSVRATRWIRFTAHVFVPVFIGAAIYVLWRSPHLNVFRWVEAVGLADTLHGLRAAAAPVRRQLPSWVLLSLPDGLWVYGITACLSLIWRDARGAERLLWLSVGPLLGVGSELGQGLGLVPGTFDLNDLLAGVIGAALAIILTSNRGGTSWGTAASSP